jgi:hypothetical protein
MDSYSDETPHRKHQQQPSQQNHHRRQPPSSSELLSSAKYAAEAAKAALNHESGQIDKVRVAAAAEDFLDAAAYYGKLEEKSYGKYVDKAEDYLHKYSSKQSSSTTTAAGHQTYSYGHQTHNSGGHHSTAAEQGYSGSHQSSESYFGSHQSSEGGEGKFSEYGDYFKLAQGFLKKH